MKEYTNEQKLNAEVQRLTFKVESYQNKLAKAHDEITNLESAVRNQQIYIQNLEQAVNGGEAKDAPQVEAIKKSPNRNQRRKRR